MKTIILSDEECIFLLIQCGLHAARKVGDVLQAVDLVHATDMLLNNTDMDLVTLVEKLGDYSQWKPPLEPVNATIKTFSEN